MLLTINYTGKNTSDIGYLLHKNPARPQEFTLSYGKAYVFYPEVSDASTTCALLLDIDPIDLARGKAESSGGGLFDYVNDRPYVSSSFMSTAISKVFGTAMGGRSKEKQELADTPLDLTAKIHMLAAPNKDMLSEVFEPLGYSVRAEMYSNDEKFPVWGESKYVTLTLSGTLLLKELLNHLYVLIPVFDTRKHYYFSKQEIDKLLAHGEGWLKEHPKREYIIRRYLSQRRGWVNQTLERLQEEEREEKEMTEQFTEDEREEKEMSEQFTEEEREAKELTEDGEEEEAPVQPLIKKPLLNQVRLQAVLDAVRSSGAKSVIDMGCGEGNLARLLLRERQLQKIAVTDVSVIALERTKMNLKIDRLHDTVLGKMTLFQSSLTYRDKRFENFDCACVVEVIEHMDISRLSAFVQILFGFSKPKTVILTTPNTEYNINYNQMKEGSLRHTDHRFEWNREQFTKWTNKVCAEYGYSVVLKGIGDIDETYGTPTQMGVFTRNLKR